MVSAAAAGAVDLPAQAPAVGTRGSAAVAQYALYDTERHEITFHRVAYDASAAAARIRAAGLPEALAYRVEAGI